MIKVITVANVLQNLGKQCIYTKINYIYIYVATHVIVDCSMSINQFWEYLTVIGPEGGIVTTHLSHAQDGKANVDIYDAVRHQDAQSIP